jgi:hypothetical protein
MGLELAIDPNTLVLLPNHDRQEVRRRLDCIMTWRAIERDHHWLKLRIARESMQIFRERNLYPVRTALQQSLTAANLDQIYSVNDIARQVDHLLSREPLDEATSLEDVLWENFKWDPALACVCSELEISLQRMFLLIVVSAKSGRPIFCATTTKASVSIEADITMGLPEASVDFSLPKRINGSVECVHDFEAICDLIDPISCWEVSTTAADIKRAIQLQCRKYMMGANLYNGWKSLPSFYIGDGFIASLKECQCWGRSTFAKQVLETIAETVLMRNKLEIKYFRETENSTEPRKRLSDGALGCRVHVTKKKEGFRLMPWELKNGTFELANIGPKKELSINAGDPSNAT